jgi:hypothetical protein
MEPKHRNVIAVLIALFLVSLIFGPIPDSPASTQGDTYYVATDGVDDLPGGTSADPWAACRTTPGTL